MQLIPTQWVLICVQKRTFADCTEKNEEEERHGQRQDSPAEYVFRVHRVNKLSI